MSSEKYDQKNRSTNASKHTPNINRAVLSQNVLRTDQFKHNCLGQTIGYMWEGMRARQKVISRAGHTDQMGSIAMF